MNVEREFLTIDELSEYLNLKRSTLYALVESGELPHYRIGRRIRFRRDDINRWMEDHRRESINVDKRAKGVLKTIGRSQVDVDSLVKKSIDKVKGNLYTLGNGEPDRDKGLRKGVSDGAL